MTTLSPSKKWLPWILAGIGLALTVVGIIIYYRKKKAVAAPIADAVDAGQAVAAPPVPGASNRGLRNNNPGNIRLTAQSWKGKIPKAQNTDGSFEQFTEKFWGVRAMTRIIKNWIDKGQATTLSAIIHKYAPSHENNPGHYIQVMKDETGISPDAILTTDKDTMKKLIVAMGSMESGKGAITESDFESAWLNLA